MMFQEGAAGGRGSCRADAQGMLFVRKSKIPADKKDSRRDAEVDSISQTNELFATAAGVGAES